MNTEDKGKYVSRALFATLQAQKDKLYKDIKVIVSGTIEGNLLFHQWKNVLRIRINFLVP